FGFCSPRHGGPGAPCRGCARGGRACIACRGRAALRNYDHPTARNAVGARFAALRADFAHSANGATPAKRDSRARPQRHRLVRRLGLEPRTLALKGQCSTIELPSPAPYSPMEEARSSSIISIQRCRVWSCHSARPIRYSRCSFVEAPAQFVRIKSGQARQPANVLSVACGVPLQFQERKIVRIGNPEMYSLEHTRTILVEP